MILTDNVVYLKHRYPTLWERIKSLDEGAAALELQTSMTRSGEPTLTVDVEGRSIYIHSKYNPVEEAEQFINQYEDLEEVRHVFFYGVGLGYHVDAFIKKFPDKKITLYEPELGILAKYLERKSLTAFRGEQLKTLFVEENSSQVQAFLKQFLKDLNEELLLIQLPSYERIFADRYKNFSDIFKNELFTMKTFIAVYSSFEKRWTYNAMQNLKTVVKTSNIQMQKKPYFQGKPVIIVAAGPSLQEEIENLKYIKANGLAYIFSVGTAINALLAVGLEPDAVCSFDPSSLNCNVFERLRIAGKSHIPLIYGTTITYEVLRDYLGPKLHMITTKDAISNYYLRPINGDKVEFVNDAPSIAVVAVELFSKLNCNPIILVGQNLAYKDNRSYAANANVFKSPDVTDNEKRKTFLVESVDGGQVSTTNEFNAMRTQMEIHTGNFVNTEIINTTNGGAKIANTKYIPLHEVLEHRLKHKIVEENWYAFEESCYDPEHAMQQTKEMNEAYELLMQHFEQATRLFNLMNGAANRRKPKELSKILPKFDKLFIVILENKFFDIFSKQLNKVRYELLFQRIKQMRNETDLIAKARMIIEEFGKFIYTCHEDALNLDALFQIVQKEVIPSMEEVNHG